MLTADSTTAVQLFYSPNLYLFPIYISVYPINVESISQMIDELLRY